MTCTRGIRTVCSIRPLLSVELRRIPVRETRIAQNRLCCALAKRQSLFQPSLYFCRDLSQKSTLTSGIVGFVNDIDKNLETSSNATDSREEEEEEDRISGKHYIGNSETLYNFMDTLKENKQVRYTDNDWEELESRVINENPRLANSVEALCMKAMLATRSLDVAMSYLDYIRCKGRAPRISTLSLFIDVCGQVGGRDMQEHVFCALAEIEKQTDVFDWITAKHLIRGLSHTDQWRRSLDLLEMAALSHQPGSAFHSPIALAALREGDTALALSLLERLGQAGLRPQEAVLERLVQTCSEQPGSLNIATVLAHLNRFQWFPLQATARKIEEHFLRFEEGKWTSSWTTVDKRGICRACRHPMAQLELCDEEFGQLQQEMLERALVGRNVYLKSSPEEVRHFQDFVSSKAPFDIVIDALNVAYKNQGRLVPVKSPQLRKVVEYFAKYKHKKVLVVGRKHMQRWPRKDMEAIESVATTYYAENLSSDDPFGLYATISSGRHAMYVSDDYLRDHKHQLSPLVRGIFEKWQRTRQITNVNIVENKVMVKMPSRHDTGPQQDGRGWHIPYDNGSDGPSYQHPNAWLCLRRTALK